MSGRHWDFDDIIRARTLRDAGMTAGEIARAIGRSRNAVSGLLRRDLDDIRDEDKSARAMRLDATNGSARLLAEIQRVFGA